MAGGVSYSGDGRLGTITLDNPPANSYAVEFIAELGHAIRAADEDPDARIIVVRSASEKFFSAGADIKRFLANDVDANMEMIRLAHEGLSAIARSHKLFMACIAGHALGGGLEIALACDVRYAVAGRYRLGTPEVTLGLLPGNGGTQRLPRLIGVGPALELLTTGRQVGPDEALSLGLVSQVFDDEAALTAHVQSLTALPPLAISEIKRAVYLGVQQPLAEGLELERELIEGLFGSADAREGLTAFSEKRAPRFAGA
ncbi:MAG TPA: enoyl-CoA hydratase/isomerase family protein [Solirubrobacteraceae bacterium]|jgi:enoyl-CoA hydratase/carnithine racemase|nr:enoyl-CoA hydratase/isomerase family protein [Solirubrobacteraceae bacterium]